MAWRGTLGATLFFTFVAVTFVYWFPVVTFFTFVAVTFVYWFPVVTFLQDLFHRRCERRFGVTIDASSKHWQISGAGSEHWQISGAGSAARTAKLQLLRPVYILAAVGAWLFAATLFFMTIKTAERVAEGPTSARRVFFTCLGLGLLRSP